VPLRDVAAIRARKRDAFTGYNFLAARADSPLLAAIATRLGNRVPPG
jgi:hypothetical protein